MGLKQNTITYLFSMVAGNAIHSKKFRNNFIIKSIVFRNKSFYHKHKTNSIGSLATVTNPIRYKEKYLTKIMNL